ncbi:MAG: UvrD-helicase domain-containing protein [bacterium]|nr:UvrD-helicase domain-containing protein [bacterium]
MQLDAFQYAAVNTDSARLSLSAPAGSGKTRVLIERVARLCDKSDTRARDVLVVTFARKAAQELRDRLHERGQVDVEVKTFHAWALSLVKKMHVVPGRLLNEVEQFDLLWRVGARVLAARQYREMAERLCLDKNWSRPFLLRLLLSAISTLRSAGLDAASAKLKSLAERDTCARLTLAVLAAYTHVLEKNGVADFSYLIQLAHTGSTRFAPSYQHVLIDEVQDAAATELALIKRFCAKAQTQTWVGDPNQSLYGWRGSAGVIPNAERRLSLSFNYRSDARVIALVNTFLSKKVSGSTAPGAPVRLIKAARAANYTPRLILYPRYEEDRLCVRLIRELLALGYQQRDITILARAHQPLDQLKRVRSEYKKVRRTTVHAFKGLESPVVIVINVAQNRFGFPIQAAGDMLPLQELASYDRAQEEQNIFYVAVTRARDRLILCAPKGDYSPFTEQLPSRVIQRGILQANKP